MKTKSKWKGALLGVMALILALSLAVVGAPGPKQANEAEALDLIWGLQEGIPALGLPAGAGALLDVAVIPGTSTVYVLCDQTLSTPAGANNVVVYRSDDGGLSWGTPIALPVAATEVGVDIEVSPAYSQDGTVFVLTNDPVVGAGIVYTSDDKGVTWVWATVATGVPPAQAHCLAVDPNFNSLLSGGTIAVGTVWNGVAGAWYETWQSPVVGWSGAWTAIPSVGAFPTTLDLMYAPNSSVRLIAVQYDGITASVWGATGSIATGFPAYALPTAAVLYFEGAQVTTNAVIAVGTDYDPVASLACPNCPMHFFVATDDGPLPANVNGSTFWFDPTLALFVDLKAASTLPALHMDTSGLVARGMYTRAELLTGCSNTPLTYNLHVRTMVWSTPVYIEGNGGPIGVASNNVGVKLAYGSAAYAITTQVPASAYLPTIAPAAAAGDLTCLSTSADFGATWSDTCLTQEDFRFVIQDQLWVSALSGFIVTDTGTGIQSVFKCPMTTQWKRVDRWQGVQRITVSTDGAAIVLLDTSTTGMKVLRSVDGGETFTATTADPVAIVTIQMTAIAAGSANDIFVGDWNGHIYVTHDGGVTWTDAGQVAAAIKSLDVPRFYTVVKHVIAGVDTLVGFNQDVLVSKDDGATWSPAGIAMWGGGGFGAAGHIEAKFSPMYNGATENNAYAGINGTGADNMYRADLSAFAPWTNMALPTGMPTAVANFEVVKVDSTGGNVMYVLDAALVPPVAPATAPTPGAIYATYYPELVSGTVPLWRTDLAAPVLWQANGGAAVWGLGGPTPGNTQIPCPFDAVVGASVTLFVRDNGGLMLPWDNIPNITETTAFLTPIANYSPANGAIVPSNNMATGEPVELQWTPVGGATSYDIYVVTDINNPGTYIIFATSLPLQSELSIGVGTLVDGQTYYWRTRVATTTAMGDHTGPWSAFNSFTVESVDIHRAPTLLSPASGDVDVPQAAMFRWSVIEDVVSTDFQLANDGAFTDIVDEATLGAEQTYAYPGELSLSSTYHWRVRGHGGTGIDAWTTPWAEGIFTTIGPPPPQPTPIIVQPGDTVIIEQVGPDTPGWVWALIAVGGVLAIVVIVLIMRTRRPV